MTTLFVIEDEDIIRQSLVHDMDWSAVNCEVVGEASNGETAIEMINELTPDIVISDIQIYGKDGLEVCRFIHENLIFIRTILITGYSKFEYAQTAIKYGVSDFILKPTDPNELIGVVRKLANEIEKEKEKNLKYEQYERILSGRQRGEGEFAKAIVSGQEEEKPSSLAMGKIMEYLNEHYSEPIELKRLGEVVYMNPNYICRLIKKETGLNYTEILTRIRIGKAKQLLGDIQYKTYEIAERVGIQDPKYFSQLFKKVTGLTPSEYRNKSNGYPGRIG